MGPDIGKLPEWSDTRWIKCVRVYMNTSYCVYYRGRCTRKSTYNSQKRGQEAAQLRISICPSTAHDSSSGRQSLDSSQSLRLDRASSVRCFRAVYQSELIFQFTETHAGFDSLDSSSQHTHSEACWTVMKWTRHKASYTMVQPVFSPEICLRGAWWDS